MVNATPPSLNQQPWSCSHCASTTTITNYYYYYKNSNNNVTKGTEGMYFT